MHACMVRVLSTQAVHDKGFDDIPESFTSHLREASGVALSVAAMLEERDAAYLARRGNDNSVAWVRNEQYEPLRRTLLPTEAERYDLSVHEAWGASLPLCFSSTSLCAPLPPCPIIGLWATQLDLTGDRPKKTTA